MFAGFPQVQSWMDCSDSQLQPLTLGLGVQACKFTGTVCEKTVEIPLLPASRRICSTLSRWSKSRLWFACLLLFSNRCRDGRWVFLGPCTQVHGQGSPTIRVGEGVAGTAELAPRVFLPIN